ncbi:uncharacterized protein [Anabrus simplex]|uniref:uncharacterized protein n=1 Tax=Anabrus simplex TaxID=316456 RepID=UPI0035A2AF14
MEEKKLIKSEPEWAPKTGEEESSGVDSEVELPSDSAEVIKVEPDLVFGDESADDDSSDEEDHEDKEPDLQLPSEKPEVIKVEPDLILDDPAAEDESSEKVDEGCEIQVPKKSVQDKVLDYTAAALNKYKSVLMSVKWGKNSGQGDDAEVQCSLMNNLYFCHQLQVSLFDQVGDQLGWSLLKEHFAAARVQSTAFSTTVRVVTDSTNFQVKRPSKNAGSRSSRDDKKKRKPLSKKSWTGLTPSLTPGKRQSHAWIMQQLSLTYLVLLQTPLAPAGA